MDEQNLEYIYKKYGLKTVGTFEQFKTAVETDINAVYNNPSFKLNTIGSIDEFKAAIYPNKSNSSTWSIQDLTLQKLQAEKSPLYREGKDLRKIKAENIIAKYDKDREQISYSLYNEGVDKKKAKETVEPVIQMPQDNLKAPDLGKAKFVKEWTDKKIADKLSVEDALTLTPKEAYRVTKGAHAIDVNDKLVELTDQNKWGVITELQKSYARFIQGFSNSVINSDNTKS